MHAAPDRGRSGGTGASSPRPEASLIRHRALATLLAVLAVLLPGLARAATLAVLPLEKGAAGEAYAGLGTAMAGMLISDLSAAEGLELVERERLDALLTEIELGDQGFLDPSTAQKLGEGLGAELVLVGSYSVVGETLALDGRLVEVASGRVLDGAAAQGPVQDFVTVEKTLVEGLLAELDATLDARARRAFYSNVPTEDWEAFTAWSQGQALLDEGELDAARAAFQRALDRDPAFTAAVEGLSALQALLARTAATDVAVRSGRYAAAQQAVLAGTVDPRTRKPGDTWTPDEVAGLALRWRVLIEQQAHCQRYDEMRAYLDLVGWDPAAHAATLFDRDTRLDRRIRERAEGWGHEPWDDSVRHPEEVVQERVISGEGDLWDDTHAFLFHDLSRLYDAKDVGLAMSLLACHPPSVRAREIRRWGQALDKHGQAQALGDGPRRSGLSNADQLRVLAAWSEAVEGRITPQVQAPLEALLARHPDADDPTHQILVRLLETLAIEADHQDRWRTGLLGLDVPTIRARVEGVETGQAPFDPDGANWCGALHQRRWADEAKRLRQNWDEELEDDDDAWHETHWSAKLVRIAGDLGCIDGVPARYTSADDVRSALKTSRARLHPVHGEDPNCDTLLDSLEMILSAPIPDPAQVADQAVGLAHTLTQLRCIVEIDR